MTEQITLESRLVPSEDIVAREIEGDLIIVPLTGGMDGEDDEAIFTLNATGRAIWKHLDGKHTLSEIAALLAGEYDAERETIEADVLGLVTELARRKMLVTA